MSDKNKGADDVPYDFSAFEAKLTKPQVDNNYVQHKESIDKTTFAKRGIFIVLSAGVLLFGGYFTVMKLKAKYFSGPEKEKQVVMSNAQGRGDLGLPEALPAKKTEPIKPAGVPDTKEAKDAKPAEPIKPIIQPMRLSARIDQSAQPGQYKQQSGNTANLLPARTNPYDTSGGMMSPDKAAETAKKLGDSIMAKMGSGATGAQSALTGLSDGVNRTGSNLLNAGTGARSAVALTGALNKAYSLGDLSFILAGSSFISCELQNELLSSVPGESVCIVQRPVYSSDGKNILIPVFSKLSGPYKGEISRGESRIANIFNSIKTPDGIEVRMDAQGVSNSGATGLEAEIDNKWFQRIGTSLMLAVFQDGVNFASQSLAYNQYLREVKRKEDVASSASALASKNVTSTTSKVTTTNPDTGEVTEVTTVNAPANNSSSSTSNFFGNNTTTSVNPAVWGTDSSRATMRSLAEKILEQQLTIKPVGRVKKGTEIQVYVRDSLDFSGVYKNTNFVLANKQ